MRAKPEDSLEIVCPHCGARLKIDAALGKVIAHEPPARHAKAPDLAQTAQLLEKEKARREALFNESAEEQKVKSQLLERKFEEALKKGKNQPATPPLKDIDLD